MNDLPKLVCTACHAEHPWSLAGSCRTCGGLLDVDYDLAHARIGEQGGPMARFRDLLPLRSADSIIDDGEGNTRCLHARELGRALGLDALWVKVEGDNPTRTVKDRQGNVTIAALRELGVSSFVTASTGNSCTSMARVLARFPDMHMHAFVGDQFLERVAHADTPNISIYWLPHEPFVAACEAAVWFAEEAGLPRDGGFFFFGKREGLKTLYLEAALQMPVEIEAYIQGVSSAIGVYAADRAAHELQAMGRTRSLPRLICVQERSCDPMVRAFARGAATMDPADIVAHPHGLAKATLRGDASRTYPYIHRIVVASGGSMLSVCSDEIERARELTRQTEGLEICAASALSVAAAEVLARSGTLRRDTVTLLNLTGADRPPSGRRADFIVEREGGGWRVTKNDAAANGVEMAVIDEVRRSLHLTDDVALHAETVLLDNGLSLDSVAVLELLLALETRFERRIEEHEVTAENLATVGSLARLMAIKVARRA